MVRKKRQSKRLTLKKKYFIERKVREHDRQERKEAKKNPSLRKGLKKDPGIPNMYPFKQQFVEKMERMREKQEQDAERQKEDRAKEIERKRQMSIQEMRELAKRKEQAYEQRETVRKQREERGVTAKEQNKDLGGDSRRAYYREFKKVVKAADVILEVLDARDPLGCRCPEVEQAILAQDPNKKIVLILNKIDLAPSENVDRWLKYLRAEFPTLAFKCSTQKQKRNIGHAHVNPTTSDLTHHTSECLGADTLLQLLKNYCRNVGIKTSVTVGIIGYPNVGKSSLINSLKRSRAVGVGATPGFTKTTQEIHLDKHVKLLDCPGIVFSADTSDPDLVLRNCIKLETLEDPIGPVEAILRRVNRKQMMDLYSIATFDDSREFLAHMAHKLGKLGKGGIPNYNAAAKKVLQDWNQGKIPFYTEPPERLGVHVGASIVNSWAKELDLEDVERMEKGSVMTTLVPSLRPDQFIPLGVSSLPAASVDRDLLSTYTQGEDATSMEDLHDSGEDEDEEDMDEEEEEEELQVSTKAASGQRNKLHEDEDALNPIKSNRDRLKQAKQLKKRQQKKRQAAMSEDDEEEEGEQAYSFSSHFVADNDGEPQPLPDADEDLFDVDAL